MKAAMDRKYTISGKQGILTPLPDIAGVILKLL
jgi:hypothetical protein